MSRFPQGPTGGGGVRGRERRASDGDARSPRSDAPREEKIADGWGDYLKDGYFDAEGNLRIEYLSREKLDPLVYYMANGEPRLSTGQIRRFFQHCRAVETRLKTGQSTWGAERPHIEFLDAAAQDAFGKVQRKIPSLFFDFISRNVHAIKTEKDFLKGFLPHFEALVGFASAHLQRERN